MYRKLFINFILIAGISFGIASCAQDEKGTPIKKGSGGNGGSQKPDEKTMQAALNEKVLVLFKDTSELLSAQSTDVKLGLELIINAKMTTPWRPLLNVKINGPDDTKTFPEGILDKDLQLTMTARRIEKSKAANDLGYLVLKLQLQREDENQKLHKSYLLALIDLNLSKKAFKKTQVIFPVDNFSLDEWIAKQLKKP